MTPRQSLMPVLLLASLLSSPAAHGQSVDGGAVEGASGIGTALVTRSVIETALALIGVRYRFGGSSPVTGFDCSGLVTYVFRETLGLKLPRTAAQIASVGLPVAREDLQPGDLVFFNTRGPRHSHVGIYLGDARFVHAPSARTRVRVDRLDDPSYRDRFDGARRIDPISLISGS